MSTPLTFIEDRLAERADLVRGIELMERHLADPRSSPSVGFRSAGEDVTAESNRDG